MSKFGGKNQELILGYVKSEISTGYSSGDNSRKKSRLEMYLLESSGHTSYLKP